MPNEFKDMVVNWLSVHQSPDGSLQTTKTWEEGCIRVSNRWNYVDRKVAPSGETLCVTNEEILANHWAMARFDGTKWVVMFQYAPRRKKPGSVVHLKVAA